jgi:hypothetical protein
MSSADEGSEMQGSLQATAGCDTLTKSQRDAVHRKRVSRQVLQVTGRCDTLSEQESVNQESFALRLCIARVKDDGAQSKR